jgi:hypothetical protein
LGGETKTTFHWRSRAAKQEQEPSEFMRTQVNAIGRIAMRPIQSSPSSYLLPISLTTYNTDYQTHRGRCTTVSFFKVFFVQTSLCSVSLLPLKPHHFLEVDFHDKRPVPHVREANLREHDMTWGS